MLFEGQIHDFLARLPWNVVKREKSSLRAIIEQRRRIYPKENIAADSAQIAAAIESLPQFQSARTILVYYPIRNEVNLIELMNKHMHEKTILLPVTHRKSIEVRQYTSEDALKKGKFNVPEPQGASYEGKIDIILVPGVAFDKHRNRIGRGGGFYDRYLKKHKDALQIGVCYDFQLRDNTIPHQWFDHKVDMIITPTRAIG